MGQVLYGRGNNGKDGMEGLRYKNVFGTNMGTLLPKNALLTDLIIGTALQNKKSPVKFPVLDNSLEDKAVDVMVKRLLTEK